MARKFEWRKCEPFCPGHIPGIEILEIEKKNVIAYGVNTDLPDKGPYLSIDESIELLKKLKKSGYEYYRVERIDNPNCNMYYIAFVGMSENIHDTGSGAGVIAPLLTAERDGWYFESEESEESEDTESGGGKRAAL